MKRDELRELLMPYADGELDAAEAQRVEAGLADDPECRAELEALKDLSSFAQMAFDAPIPEARLEGVYARVMAELEPAPARPVAIQSGFTSRMRTWMHGFFAFERPLALAGFAAILVAVVGVVSLSGDSASTSSPSNIAGSETNELRRRGAEVEVKTGTRGQAWVETVEVANGKVVIDDGADEQDRPLVLWHVVEGDGAETPPGSEL